MAGTGKGPLRIAIEDFIETFGLSDRIAAGLKKQIELLEVEGYEYLIQFANRLGVADKLPFSLSPRKHSGIVAPAQFDIGLVVAFIWGLAQGVIKAISNVLERVETYKLEHVYRTARVGIREAIALFWRHPEWQEKLESDLADSGWDTDRAKMIAQALQPHADPAIWWINARRGVFDMSNVVNELKARGYSDLETELLLNSYVSIPGVSDITRMATREAWNDSVANLFGYDEQAPTEFYETLSKIGYDPDWAKRYWRAHWQLPGISQAFEMLHRLRPGTTNTPFAASDLDTLLKANDVPEFFRKRLTAISYQPYTRVDIRRMYAAGVLSEDEVYQAHLDIGYDAEKARKLTDFTTHQDAAEQRGVTKDAVISSYRDGLITKDTCMSMLQEIGYETETAEFFIRQADYSINQVIVNEQIATIKAQYLANILDDVSVYSALGPLDLPSERMTNMLAAWRISKLARIASPSKSDLNDWYRAGAIKSADYLEGYKRLGYTAKDAGLYLAQIDRDIQQDAKEQADKARAAADRQAAATVKNAKAQERADLDVLIAQARLQIADINIVLHDELTTEEDYEILQDEKVRLSDLIASYNLDKAKISAR